LTINLIKNANLKIILLGKVYEFTRKTPDFRQARAVFAGLFEEREQGGFEFHQFNGHKRTRILISLIPTKFLVL
jgi:hypothetical protein